MIHDPAPISRVDLCLVTSPQLVTPRVTPLFLIMCGIVAVIHADAKSTSAAADIHDALYLLQHRGQDACGITTCAAGGRIYQCKGNGMASKVFHDGERVRDLHGFMGLGHLR